MKLNKFTVIMAVLLMAILAIGAVSAESIDDSNAIAADDGDSGVVLTDSSVEDVSAAETVVDSAEAIDESDDGGAVLTDNGTVYQITENSYSTYFKNDGTPTEALSADGNYELQLGVLQGKNFNINSGKNIIISPYITEEGGSQVGGDLIECTLSFGPNVESVLIKGLTFHDVNKNAISIDSSKDVTITGNTMFISVDSQGEYTTAIFFNGPVSNLKIDNNAISMISEASCYGISSMAYGAETNPRDITISNNRIDMQGSFQSGFMEGLYISDPENLIVENNSVTVNTVNDVYAYGIQVADDVQYVYYDDSYTGNITSPRNIVIKGNQFNIASQFMTYALTILDYGTDGYDPYYLEDEDYPMYFPNFNAFDTNILITENEVIAKSTRGVMGIVGQTYNMTVSNNNLVVIGGSAEGITSQDALRNGTYALGVQYFAMGPSNYTVVVKDNNVVSNVTVEYLSDDSYSRLVTFENNTAVQAFVIDDNSYSTYFNDDGTPKSTLPSGNYALIIGNLSDKNMILSGFGIELSAYDDSSKLNNCQITLNAASSVSISHKVLLTHGEIQEKILCF